MAEILPTPAVGSWHEFTGTADWAAQPAVGSWHEFRGDPFGKTGWHVGRVVF